MKKLFLLIFVLSVSIVASAAVVSPERAMQVAQSFVPAQKTPKKNAKGATTMPTSEIVYTHYMPESGKPAIYVVNIGSGFALVSADDVAHPILGYNYGKAWPTDGQALPPSVKSFLDDLAAQMEAASEHPQDAETAAEWQEPRIALRRSPKRTPSSLPDSVGPLLTTTWNQGQYYNASCPEDGQGPDGHVLTGCVATAMAQIIKYWGDRQTISPRGIHSYESPYGELTVNYDTTTYDFGNMPNELTAQSTPAQVNAVATLIRDCGVAVNMHYSISFSGAYDVDARAALINFFHISPEASIAEKAYYTDEEWNTMLRENIAAGKPIMYSGQGDAGGHSFICHGYKQGGYFYFNFGWGGFADGWFLTNAINPSYEFNSNQAVILDIMPDNSSNVILGQSMGTSIFALDEPMEFCHIRGYNRYICSNYGNGCYSKTVFVSRENNGQLVVDILNFEDQNVSIYDDFYANNLLRSLYAGSDNDLSPAVSSDTVVSIVYNGLFYNAGFQLQISRNSPCRMVSNIVTAVDTTTVHVAWIESGTATQWQVEYGPTGFTLGDGTRQTVSTNTLDIINLPKFTEYDIYIRSVCGEEQYGMWNKVTVMVETAYWQDIVTTQPDGFYINYETNQAEISTAEGFAWWTKFDAIWNARLMCDIDLSKYKWRPMNIYGTLNGQGHIVSGVYVNEHSDDVGLFASIQSDAIVENVGLRDAYIRGDGNRTGGLCGSMYGRVRNCYVTQSYIKGKDFVGGLSAQIAGGKLTNSYVNVEVSGNRWSGLLVGFLNEAFVGTNGIITNCYAAGNLKMYSQCYNAGIAAYAPDGTIEHCYSVETSMGCVGYKGWANIADTSAFIQSETAITLLRPIVFDDVPETDLITALNRGVELYNDSTLNTWTADTGYINKGYPIFGDRHILQCPNVSAVAIKNIIHNGENAVVIGWKENGDATQWCIRYRRHDMQDSAYSYVLTTNNPDTIYGISLGYVYDFSVRAICDFDMVSGWGSSTSEIVDIPFWTDIVIYQPAGYVEDELGNVEISSAEGLAWFSSKVNGLNGLPPDAFEGKVVKLVADVDLKDYRWFPIGRFINCKWTEFSGLFDGQNRIISNIYINDSRSGLGLFGHVNKGIVRNVNINRGTVASIYSDSNDFYSPKSCAVGGLIGYATDCYEISNCHSSATVLAQGSVGSLCGLVNNGILNHDAGIGTNIFNCSASGNVYGRRSCGGLIGEVYAGDALANIEIHNCYASGDVMMVSGGADPWNRGGLIGLLLSARVQNCYSTGKVNKELYSQFCGKVIGCPYLNAHVHYVYGLDSINDGLNLIGDYCPDISNTSQFHHTDVNNVLLSQVSIDGQSVSDLQGALNAWVIFQNDPKYRMWTSNIDGYPTFGDNYEPSCYAPTDFEVSQATTIGDSIIRTQLEWSQVGEPEGWEIAYVAAQHSITEGVVLSVATKPHILTDIPTGKPLDFYVRAICGNNDTSKWVGPITYIPDKLRWTEVVTSKPEGYTEDADGNVYISSAEGLAWLASVVNGLNGVPHDESRFRFKQIDILTDIDISKYRWTPIGRKHKDLYAATTNGNGHVIRGLYCNELDDYLGLFGWVQSGSVSNLHLVDCSVYGIDRIGAITGYADADIYNCSAEGLICGLSSVGGLVGFYDDLSIKNAYFIGNIATRGDITINNKERGGVGGISSGGFDYSIINCYVVSEISNDEIRAGIVGGGTETCIFTNCYYKEYETILPIFLGGYITANNSSFTGSGSQWSLKTPSFISGELYSDLVEALNAWVDANNSEGKYRHWVADTENVNGGFPIFDPTESPTTDIESVQPSNINVQKILYNGQIFILRGDKVYNITGQEIK